LPLADLKSKHSKKDLRVWSAKEEIRPLFKKYYDTRRHEPNNDFLYGLLCLIYDGINTIEELNFLFLR
jgi:hypothetical protein